MVVDDEVEMSPETLDAEPESQLNHTNLFVKNNLNEPEEITDIANTGVSAKKRKHDEESSRESLPPKKRVLRSRSTSTSFLSSNDMEELEEEDLQKEDEKRKHDEENSGMGLPPRKRVSRGRSRSTRLMSSNDMEDEDVKEAHEKGEYVKLSQKCKVSICPLWSRWNLNPEFILNEVNRVIRIRLAELKSDVGHLNRKITKYHSEHVMEMEVAKEREIWLTEQVNTFSISQNSFND